MKYLPFNISFIFIIIILFPVSFLGQESNQTLRGQVVDSQTGEPITDAKIIVIGLNLKTKTDKSGKFSIENIPEGEIELYVTTIGYGLVKKRVSLDKGKDNLIIALNQESASLLGSVSVDAGAFPPSETNTASESSLNKKELKNLSTVLIADPIRAVQSLPGVVGNDDFRDDFIVRGAGFRRNGFFIDGIQLPENPTHTINGDEDAGQISIFNSDAIDSVSLLNGAYPSKYGESTAGVLLMNTRDGNLVKLNGRLVAGLLSSSAIFDAPFPNKKGSWLVSARKSYLQYILNKLNDDDDESLGVDFTDIQSKVIYDLNSKHQIGGNFIWSHSDFDAGETNNLGLNEEAQSNSTTNIAYFNWNYYPNDKFFARTKVFGLFNNFANKSLGGAPLQEGDLTNWGIRSDLNIIPHSKHQIEAGVYLQSLNGKNLENRFSNGEITPINNFDESGNQQGYYLQDTWKPGKLFMALTFGARVDRSSFNNQTVISPKVSFSFSPLKNTSVRLGWGQYTKFPGFRELFSRNGNPNLRTARSTHYNISIEHLISEHIRLTVEGFNRDEKDLFFSLNDFYLDNNGDLSLISFPYNNSLRGYARGFEITLHKRSANRLSGWVSYSFVKTKLSDQISGFSFVSDFDQKHTVSVYGNYRINDSWNLSSQWRYGSGLPFVGFYQESNGQLIRGSQRNTERLPAYNRLDFRINKSFHFKRSKLTLSGELLNVFGRENVRQNRRFTEELLPFVPSVGISFEF